MARWSEHGAYPRRTLPSNGPRKNQALASDTKEPDPARELLPPRRSRSPDRGLRRRLQSTAYHEAIGNLTPADVYFGRGHIILIERERIKRQTIVNRRLLHQRQAA